MSHAKKSILEALSDAGIGVARATKLMRKEVGSLENVEFVAADADTHINGRRGVSTLENADAAALIKYFFDKSNKEPNFSWNSELDSEGRLMNIFFSDSQSAIDYDFVGDVISIDNTFRTNRYNLNFVLFVGVNHHRQTVIFGVGLLCDETTESFQWLLSSFLSRMQSNQPQIVFSDQCHALMNAIDSTFTSARHHLCQCHINENATSHFGSLNTDCTFKNMWQYCMNGCDTEDEFERCWKELIDSYSLGDNKWLSSMYNFKSRWASVFTRDRFTAGLDSTSRIESTNKVINDLCLQSTLLHDFVLMFEELQCSWHRREFEGDAHCHGRPDMVVPDNHLLTHAADIFTRTIYELYEQEATLSINVRILRFSADHTSEFVEFLVASSVSSIVINNHVSSLFDDLSSLNSKPEGGGGVLGPKTVENNTSVVRNPLRSSYRSFPSKRTSSTCWENSKNKKGRQRKGNASRAVECNSPRYNTAFEDHAHNSDHWVSCPASDDSHTPAQTLTTGPSHKLYFQPRRGDLSDPLPSRSGEYSSPSRH